jgi:hypothetical protein
LLLPFGERGHHQPLSELCPSSKNLSRTMVMMAKIRRIGKCPRNPLALRSKN